ncbi:hypothetical protein PoB_004896300 [Plakobranchus ocellatus]|uniref:Uncharacterized protein n=1 Tax=Plakobranchus ocellatus TaxID=259542 RepID=A0AAV4BTC6_9GAST|nr:hypothetical protein PoB_004896300 [Plakobranchus ocellatus]
MESNSKKEKQLVDLKFSDSISMAGYNTDCYNQHSILKYRQHRNNKSSESANLRELLLDCGSEAAGVVVLSGCSREATAVAVLLGCSREATGMVVLLGCSREASGVVVLLGCSREVTAVVVLLDCGSEAAGAVVLLSDRW